MRTLFFICFFFCFHISFGQTFFPIDPSNVQYREKLKTLYSNRVAQLEKVFQKKITNPRIGKDVASTYKEMSDRFIETINKGYFADNILYRNHLDVILENLKNNNPNYKSLENTQILLSYGTVHNAYAIGNDIVVIYIQLLKKNLMEFDPQMKIKYFQKIEKIPNISKYDLSGQQLYYRRDFDYYYSQKLDEDGNYVILYANNEKEGGRIKRKKDPTWVLGIVTYVDGEFEFNKLQLTTTDGMIVPIKAKNGSILLQEYSEKNGLEMRLERINY